MQNTIVNFTKFQGKSRDTASRNKLMSNLKHGLSMKSSIELNGQEVKV